MAEEFWQVNLHCQSLNEEAWAAGLNALSTTTWRAAGLDRRLRRLHGQMRNRAGGLADRSLNELADMAETGAVQAAAALRVIESDAFLWDTESLQPGAELPAIDI
ncbi:hypothetical protein [Frankia sp. Cj3]|uniref:hypothetical protein n=1 Tax=Frankia sp. Cj3 TaxID=2880976 RepID=UPI001EF72A4A|nr:hypothetical protein [Frankia sp. Cj3]